MVGVIIVIVMGWVVVVVGGRRKDVGMGECNNKGNLKGSKSNRGL